MGIDENKTIVRRYLEEIWGRWDVDAARELIAEEYVDRNPVPGVGADREGLITVVRMLGTAFPDATITIEDLIAEGDKVVDHWTVHGTHQGEFFSIPATGKPFTLTGMDIHRIRDGQIVETWHVEDILGLMRQLGAMG